MKYNFRAIGSFTQSTTHHVAQYRNETRPQQIKYKELIVEILQPPDWPRPRGYSNGMTAKGKMIFLAGMVGWNEKEEFESENFAGQARQVFQNIATLLNEAGGGPNRPRNRVIQGNSASVYVWGRAEDEIRQHIGYGFRLLGSTIQLIVDGEPVKGHEEQMGEQVAIGKPASGLRKDLE